MRTSPTKTAMPHQCAGCGRTFQPQNPAARFCSDACRKAASRARTRQDGETRSAGSDMAYVTLLPKSTGWRAVEDEAARLGRGHFHVGGRP